LAHAEETARAKEMTAIRSSVAVSRMDHVGYLRLHGEKAYEALDRIVAGEMHLRDGQMIQTLILNESGRVFADVYVGSDDEEFFLLFEGPTPADMSAFVRGHLPAGASVEVTDLSENHVLLMLNGPFAWELLALVAGPDVVGLPYLNFFHFERGLCFRAGKTGEYGYGLLVSREGVDEIWDLLLKRGVALDAAVAGLETLDQCALENFFFNIRREGLEPVTPVELQLQWRVSYRKSYVGAEALASRRRQPASVRLTTLVAADSLEIGSAVSTTEGDVVGGIVNAGFSRTREEWAALALLDTRWAYPGIDAFQVRGKRGPVPARSVRPPLLNNRSLHVSPQIHSYATRNEFQFPPLTRR
jgi:glycine cleavage system aminomethyltransferase T